MEDDSPNYFLPSTWRRMQNLTNIDKSNNQILNKFLKQDLQNIMLNKILTRLNITDKNKSKFSFRSTFKFSSNFLDEQERMMKIVFLVKSWLLCKVLPTAQAVFSSTNIFKTICINRSCQGQNSTGVYQTSWASICSLMLGGYKCKHYPSCCL